MTDDHPDLGPTGARYRFAVRFRLDPEGAAVDPAEFETTMYRVADEPGSDGWLFFRDNLWKGELNAPAHARELASDALGVPVVSIEFRAFECSDAHLGRLRTAIGEQPSEFRTDDPERALGNYFGSAIEVRG